MINIKELKAPAPPTEAIAKHIETVSKVAYDCIALGHHPFCCNFADGETVLLRHGNLSYVDHAEAVLA